MEASAVVMSTVVATTVDRAPGRRHGSAGDGPASPGVAGRRRKPGGSDDPAATVSTRRQHCRPLRGRRQHCRPLRGRRQHCRPLKGRRQHCRRSGVGQNNADPHGSACSLPTDGCSEDRRGRGSCEPGSEARAGGRTSIRRRRIRTPPFPPSHQPPGLPDPRRARPRRCDRRSPAETGRGNGSPRRTGH